MKGRDSRDVLSILRLRKRYTKQAKLSLNNNTVKCSKNSYNLSKIIL